MIICIKPIVLFVWKELNNLYFLKTKKHNEEQLYMRVMFKRSEKVQSVVRCIYIIYCAYYVHAYAQNYHLGSLCSTHVCILFNTHSN